MSTVLRLAIQKSGRLSEESIKLIKECGIEFSSGGGTLKSVAYNFPLEVLFLRDDDIPGYVADGVADIGIVGENVAVETRKKMDTVRQLGFSKCRLSIGVPKAMEFTGKESLNGMRIATSYPNILSDYLFENNIKASIHEISGSVEIAPGIGLADAICDIVSSGSTLISNGLKETEVVFRSEAILAACPQLSAEKKAILDELMFRISAVKNAEKTKYIMLNVPDHAIQTVTALLPGVKSPTVMPLAEKGWSSLHSVVKESDFWEILSKLKEAGAEGILVLPIEKIVK
ncbi:ATP phosphoribosyltransferase [Cytophaga hutchinsonii]|jgi:ATP phosphoribosyltransferase|uniref:ATP phosphoribosyltransferase n=1 Tax=Cytophaga hutchinsonii (strain ATCC 33406 / DSM 1761 / CIP 103989 / NBRC 15051 / NCIMB 9469 / D465) TaxID=269798 RepID=HIS1_CYTH3|nr:ATP phosphoribosyltransferase [Cytophaga hutchinsonii]Q11TY6.1 RecName: Full=ATP phosphoribosyltransferase; Short=ATP-PRT; Short=ATP-PRTase [Cytophaga hutchinsonii ATCC 33406]ABG59128.1 ATP phosphoribosyltransferase [Cytophaga hutchinsonii ATCC 33406]SFX36127.1 ATP phosphoribosyltransferase [Cytophaga hutchinsonii ATCC 33406]